VTEEGFIPAKVAFIIDNKVVDIISTDSRLASIFLSEPVVLDVSHVEHAAIDWDYDPETKTISGPDIRFAG
jgi:hypothetical protein